MFCTCRVEDGELEDNDLDNRSHDGDNDMEGEDVPVQSKGKKKKSGRKSAWSSEDVDDFVDIVVSNSYYKRKLIFTNTKCQRNGEIYDEILTELKKRASVRGKEFKFTVKQLRTKFKKCVSDCKQAALTIKTATGIKRFQEDRGLGNWFKTLFAVVKTRDSCQPDQALEPSCLEQSCISEKSPYSETLADPEMSSDLERNDEGRLFVPIKKSKKGKTKDKLEAAVMEAVGLVKEIVSNDSTKDLINFLREEMHQSREHELKLLQLLSKPNVGSDARQQQHPFQAMPHFGNTQYVEGGPMVANYNQQWDGTFVPNISSQPAGLPHETFRSFTQTCSMPSTSTKTLAESVCDRNVYHNL